MSGVVTASEGGPLVGIDVSLCTHVFCARSVTQADGSYSVGPVAPGSYWLYFIDQSDQRAMVSYTPSGASNCSGYFFAVGASNISGMNISIPRGYQVSGTLTPAPGGSLPGSVRASLIEPSQQYECGGWSGNDGTYSSSPVPTGIYILGFQNQTTGDWVYWSPSGLTADRNSAATISIPSSPSSGFDGQLPADWT